ncbi:unnamed protein product [Prorocentrum cordatum]|uniref:Uncharacterized protein n=1 Tax=Prorocentrum cordatum TaxID=2364126 RepID=A0ABN9QMC8_9DINO|nr:unnamed protein product [Polarella glacialis]
MVALILEHGAERTHELQLVLFACLACIRFAHLQRSTFTGCREDFIFARCARGKTRRQGVRLSYAWAVPRPSFFGIHAFGFLVELHAKLGKPSFLLPARHEQTRFKRIRRWQSSPMSPNQVVEIMRKVAKDVGKAPAQVAKVTFNSARRFLPTAANVLGFDAHMAQAVGSWMELPHGQGSAGQAMQLMSTHYSDEKALASGQAKLRVLEAFVEACRHHEAVACILSGRPARLSPASLTWEDVAFLHHRRPRGRSPPDGVPCQEKSTKHRESKKHKKDRKDERIEEVKERKKDMEDEKTRKDKRKTSGEKRRKGNV